MVTTVTGRGQVLIRDLNADAPGRDAAEGHEQDPIAVSDSKRNRPREVVLATANAVNVDWSKQYQLDTRHSCLVTRVRSAPDQLLGVSPKKPRGLSRRQKPGSSGSSFWREQRERPCKRQCFLRSRHRSWRVRHALAFERSGSGPRAALEKFQFLFLAQPFKIIIRWALCLKPTVTSLSLLIAPSTSPVNRTHGFISMRMIPSTVEFIPPTVSPGPQRQSGGRSEGVHRERGLWS